MLKYIYDIIYLSLLPIAIPYFLLRSVIRGKYRESFLGIIGVRKPKHNPQNTKYTFWIHAVSLGEVNAASAMVRELKKEYPDERFVISTITETGQAQAKKILSDSVDDIFFYPLDLSPIVRTFLRRVQPTHFIFMETEIWPNFLLHAAKRGVKIFMLNGKVSPKSFRMYMRFRFLFTTPLSRITAFCMQTKEDAARMVQMCGNEKVVHVTGNCKFDTPMQQLDSESKNELITKWKIESDQSVVVVGSTHEGEEEIILDAFESLKSKADKILFIVAPRHPERFQQVYDKISERGLSAFRTSQNGTNPEHPDIILIDEMGKLQAAYGLGKAAVVAGSFVPVGGHNLLEAAVHRIPVVYGPHMHKQKEILNIFEKEESGIQATSEELGDVILRLLEEDEFAATYSERAYKAYLKNQGSAKQNLEIILKSND